MKVLETPIRAKGDQSPGFYSDISGSANGSTRNKSALQKRIASNAETAEVSQGKSPR